MQQQPLLRKIHSRVNSSTSTTIVPPSSSRPQHRSNNHNHHHHHNSSSSYYYQHWDWSQFTTRIRKCINCIVTTLPQILVSLVSMETIIGIKIAVFLFVLLQSIGTRPTNDPLSSSSSSQLPVVIGYAVSITGCGRDPITEGAAILQHSIHLNSVRANNSSSNINNNDNTSSSSIPRMGRYDYQMYAIYHPSAKECAMTLQDLGYTLLERDTPVPISDIQGEYLRTHIANNGCCGEKELIKLYAYTLTQHPLVVHLDLDTMIVQPLDPLFDYMLLLTQRQQQSSSSLPTTTEQVQIQERMKNLVMWPDRFPPLSSTRTTTTTDAMFTYDYNMVSPKIHDRPVQGGFLLLRPSQSVYKEFQQIIRVGDFRAGSGWGGEVGPFYGSMTFQGIIPYYYNFVHPHSGLELNRCYVNTMADNPRTKKTVNNVVQGPCRTGQSEESCQDCRTVPLSQIYSVHYTICQKPWNCLSHHQNVIQHDLCRNLTHEWYHLRYDYQNFEKGEGTYNEEQFFGYCRHSGSQGYIPIPKQYYPAVVAAAAAEAEPNEASQS